MNIIFTFELKNEVRRVDLNTNRNFHQHNFAIDQEESPCTDTAQGGSASTASAERQGGKIP